MINQDPSEKTGDKHEPATQVKSVDTPTQVADDLRARVVKLLRISEIGKMYGYTPEDTLSDKVTLGIDWTSFNPDSMLGDVPRDFDQMDHTHPDAIDSEWLTTVPLYKTGIRSEKGKLEFIGVKRIDNEPRLVVGLMNNDVPDDAPEYDFQKRHVGETHFMQQKYGDHEEWEMRHRRVSDVYQGQKVASEFLHFGEAFLKKRAEETGIPQVITAETGQANVLIWLLKKGFKPATPKDEERIDRVLSGDDTLTILSGPVDETNGQKREWYLFEKEKLRDLGGVENPEIWSKDSHEKPVNYTKASFRIKLKKEIE